MKMRLFYSFVAAITLATFTSCGDSDSSNLQLVTPNTSGKTLKTVTHSGYAPKSYDWMLTYAGNSLTAATGTYREGTTTGASYTARLSYSPNALTLTTTDSKTMTVKLNAAFLVESMKVNNNTFHFNYSSSGYLTNWSQDYVNDGFGYVAYSSSATLDYDTNGDLNKVIYTGNSNYPTDICTLTFTPDDRLNINGLLPEVVAQQLGCFGFEYLYYAGALGRGTRHLVKKVHVAYSQHSADDFDVTFDYVVDNSGNVTFCSYTYGGKAAGVTYSY